MNKELLDKLKFQAAAQVSPLLEGEEWQREYSEKFAELIVRECIDTIKSNQWAKDNQAFSKGMNYSAELIKEHFGVEE